MQRRMAHIGTPRPQALVVTVLFLWTGCFASAGPTDSADQGLEESGASASSKGAADASGNSEQRAHNEGADPIDETTPVGDAVAGSSAPAFAAEPDGTPATCPALEELPQIAVNEGPFTFCTTAADCPWPDGHICYGPEGGDGICLNFDADSVCDGDEVLLLPDPPPSGGDDGICVPPAWRDYICCNDVSGFACDDAVTEPTEPDATSLEGLPCTLEELVVTPSDLSPTDGCNALLDCGGHEVVVECDGENDGTFTSGCACDVDGVSTFSGIVDGEGRDACLGGARACVPGDF